FKRQPPAIDLRMVLTVVKIVNESRAQRRRDQENRLQGAADAEARRPGDGAVPRYHSSRRACGRQSSLESDRNRIHESEFAIGPLLLELSAETKALSAGRHQ